MDGGHDGWIHQGRQQHAWFGEGTKPKDVPPEKMIINLIHDPGSELPYRSGLTTDGDQHDLKALFAPHDLPSIWTAAPPRRRETAQLLRDETVSCRVMKNDPECMALAAAHRAHAVAQHGAVDAARALHRAVMHGEDHRVALAERHHRGS